MQELQYLNKELVKELTENWLKSGLEKNDMVLVHSSLSSFFKKYKNRGIEISPEDILQSLMNAVGEKGTLIFPVYNFGFTKGIPFDIRNSKSETGILTETARNHKAFVRTGHPMFSFTAAGYYKNEFEDLDNYSAFGKDSPFAILTEYDGKIAAIDVAGEFCMTYYHFIEESENAPNRFHKTFKGRYIDKNGNETVKEYNVYSRKTDIGVETDVKPMEELLWSKGLYKGDRPMEGTGMHVIKARTVYNEASKLIKDGKTLGMLYRINSNSDKNI